MFVIARLGSVVWVAREILVEILLAGEDGAPRGLAAAAVVEGADHPSARRVTLALQTIMARGRTGHGHLGRQHAETPIVRAGFDVCPRATLPRDFDDRMPVSCQLHLHLHCRDLSLNGLLGKSWKHQSGIGVLVIDAEQ